MPHLINIYILGLIHNASKRRNFLDKELDLFVTTFESLSASS